MSSATPMNPKTLEMFTISLVDGSRMRQKVLTGEMAQEVDPDQPFEVVEGLMLDR
jgi:hypothetical protein